jgi:tetratricopeptide (TPR) repeat protein
MLDEKPAEPAPAPQPTALDWATRIKEAEEANDRSLLPGLYLSLARAEIAEGRNDIALEHLRSSVMAATKTRDGATQAEARLELAELARAAGDLTTACEHWQIARGLFHKMSEQAKLGNTERLMQQHGCPTDWVLNDF